MQDPWIESGPPSEVAAVLRNRSPCLGAGPSVISHPGENILHLWRFSRDNQRIWRPAAHGEHQLPRLMPSHLMLDTGYFRSARKACCDVAPHRLQTRPDQASRMATNPLM